MLKRTLFYIYFFHILIFFKHTMSKGNYSPVTNQLSSHQQLSSHLQLKKPINYSLAADE